MLKDRLLKYIDFKGVTKSYFEKNIGAGNGYINNVKTIGSDKLEDIINKYPDLNIEWLLTGRGDMLKKEDSFDEGSIHNGEPEVSMYKLRTDYYGVERQRIPLYEIDAAAGLNMLFSSQNTQIPLDYITVPNAPKCDGALFVRGDSMYPILKAGDIICYKTVHNLDNMILGEMYVLDIDNGEEQYLTVKFVKKSDKGSDYVTLASENKHHADRDIRIDSIRALGLIKLSIRYNTIS